MAADLYLHVFDPDIMRRKDLETLNTPGSKEWMEAYRRVASTESIPVGEITYREVFSWLEEMIGRSFTLLTKELFQEIIRQDQREQVLSEDIRDFLQEHIGEEIFLMIW